MAARWLFVIVLVSTGFQYGDALLLAADKVATNNFAIPRSCIKSAPVKTRFVHHVVDMTCLKWTSDSFVKKANTFNGSSSTAEFKHGELTASRRTPRLFSASSMSTPFTSATPFASDSLTSRRPLSIAELSTLATNAMKSAVELSGEPSARQQAELCDGSRCHNLPRSCCEEESQVVTPLNATSAITGKPVTVAQYPGLFIQTVVFSKCRYEKCSYIRGTCRQKFSPYLLMTVHPPGPVTIFGQDYVLVESGCACEPELDDTNRAALLSTKEFLKILDNVKPSTLIDTVNAGAIPKT